MPYKNIEVRAARTQSDVLNHQCTIVDNYDTVVEAKRRAKYILTDDDGMRDLYDIAMDLARVREALGPIVSGKIRRGTASFKMKIKLRTKSPLAIQSKRSN